MATAMPLTNKIILERPKDVIDRTLEAKFGDGYGQYAPNGLNSRFESYNITWAPLSVDEKTTIESALTTVGGHGTLVWTPTYETEKRFRVVGGKYTVTPIAQATFQITCQLEQRFDVI